MLIQVKTKMKEETKKKRKQVLLEKAQIHQKKLYADLNETSERALIYGKNALALGSVLYVGYTILDRYLDARFGASQKKKDPNKYETLNKIILPILIFALQQGSMSLIKKARLMLIDYLEEERNVHEA